MRLKKSSLGVGLLATILLLFSFSHLYAQDDEMGVLEYLAEILNLVTEVRDQVSVLVDAADVQDEVRALGTRVALLEQGQGKSEATPEPDRQSGQSKSVSPEELEEYAEIMFLTDFGEIRSRLASPELMTPEKYVPIYVENMEIVLAACKTTIAEIIDIVNEQAEVMIAHNGNQPIVIGGNVVLVRGWILQSWATPDEGTELVCPSDDGDEAKALESAIPSSTATPIATPTRANDARGFAWQLAVNDHAANNKDFSEFSQEEQDRIVAIFLRYFVKTVEICEQTLGETFSVLERYAKKKDGARYPWLQETVEFYEVPYGGWRLDFITRIATNSFIQTMIKNGSCGGYLSYYVD